jgi:hypothetical protein
MKIRLSALKKLIREAVEGGASGSETTIKKNRDGEPRDGEIRRIGLGWAGSNPGATQMDAEEAAESILSQNGLGGIYMDELLTAMMDGLEDASVSPEEALKNLDDAVADGADPVELKDQSPDLWAAAQGSSAVKDIARTEGMSPEDALFEYLMGGL